MKLTIHIEASDFQQLCWQVGKVANRIRTTDLPELMKLNASRTVSDSHLNLWGSYRLEWPDADPARDAKNIPITSFPPNWKIGTT